MGGSPWLYILIFILITVAVVVLLSLVFGLIIAAAGRKFSRDALDKYEKRVEGLLPGTDCGQCGYSACGECAGALLRAEKDDDVCPFTGSEDQAKIAEIRDELRKIMEDPRPVKSVPEDVTGIRGLWRRRRR